ncbi:MAG: helix-turn-helix domain-containing protein [Pyrinomonadaceae bacterium]
MANEFFEDLKQSLIEGLEHAQGKRGEFRVTSLPRPPKKLTSLEIAKIRSQTKLSQSVFAMYLNVSVKTIQAWEQGSRTPSDAALKLLSIAKDKPDAIFNINA